jgi:hypothetical protein
MPGNNTTYKDSLTFLPATWTASGLTAAQAVGVPLTISTMPTDQLPFPRRGSLMSVGVVLSTAVTNGLIRLELTRDGIDTGITFDITAASGTKALWEFAPGQLVGNKGQELGIKWGSSGSLLPTLVIDLAVVFEVQWI